MLQRRLWLQAGGALALPGAMSDAVAKASASTGTPGTLRVAFQSAEAGFDPPQVSDSSSLRVVHHIFESPLTYDHLASPAQLLPQTAAALPEVSDNFRRFVFTIRPGIFFADDPVFQGKPRELTAADYVYTIKRYYDPALNSEHLNQYDNLKLLGLTELRRRAIKARTPFPYDAEAEGLRVLDRWRFEVRLAEPAPRFVAVFASPTFCGAVAREVVEAYGSEIMAHPVGTGPFRLGAWRRASRIVLERNPRFREQIYASNPPADDADALAVAASLRGRRLPLLDRVEIQIIEETQPRWLAFLNGELDVLTLPNEYAPLAIPGGRIAPYLQRRGIFAHRTLQPSVSHSFFNFDDPMVGGYAPAQVALRRAVALAYDNLQEIRLVYKGEGVPAQSMVPPDCFGYDPALRSECGSGDRARANALLDMHGYADRNGDGFRERPDGSPLLLRIAFAPTQRGRQVSELWTKCLRAVGLQVQIEVAPFAELIKRSLAGKLMIWGFNWSGPTPDGDFYIGLAYGPNAERSNDARFRWPAFDRLYERQRVLPDGPERLALIHAAQRTMLAYVPYIAHQHPYTTDLMTQQVQGHRRHPFINDWYRTTSVAAG